MDKKELKEILDKHQKWLNGEEGGERADLRWANLSDADLRDANLRVANLSGADLRFANLRDANLRGADLSFADLRDANLSFADLRWANLRVANLDYAALSLSCATLHMHIDDRIAIQFLYHTLSNALGSKNTSDRVKKILSAPELTELANEFHKAEECGKLEGIKDAGK